MPNRILKESICTSETVDHLSAEEERCFYRLLTACDDFGRFDGRASVILGRCFPLKVESGEVTVTMVERWLQRLAEETLIQLYTVADKRYLLITKWSDHQQIRAKASKFPDPPAITSERSSQQASDINCNQPPADETNGQHMSPYSYSYSESNPDSRIDIRDSYSSSEPMTTQQKLDHLKLWLQENCDKALFAPLVLDTQWKRRIVEGFEVETLKLAVLEATNHGAGNSPIYVWRILDGWREKKAFTPEAAQALLNTHASGKQAAASAQGAKPKQTGPVDETARKLLEMQEEEHADVQ